MPQQESNVRWFVINELKEITGMQAGLIHPEAATVKRIIEHAASDMSINE